MYLCGGSVSVRMNAGVGAGVGIGGGVGVGVGVGRLKCVVIALVFISLVNCFEYLVNKKRLRGGSGRENQ
jgi:hypothetical protein